MYKVADGVYLSKIESIRDGQLSTNACYEFFSEGVMFRIDLGFEVIGHTRLDTIAVVEFEYEVHSADKHLYSKIPNKILCNCLETSIASYLQKISPAIVVTKKIIDRDSEANAITKEIDDFFLAENYIKGEVDIKDFSLMTAYVKKSEYLDKLSDLLKLYDEYEIEICECE